MTSRKVEMLTIAALLAGCGGPDTPEQYQSFEALVSAVEGANPGWRLGVNSDCRNPFLGQMLATDSTYQAYHAAGDLNGDDHVDHVIALLKGDSGRVYWALGRLGGLNSPQALTSLDWIRDAGLYLTPGRLFIGKLLSDDGFLWSWNASAGQLELAGDAVETDQ